MNLKEIKLTNFNNLDSTVLGYNNPPLRITNKDGYSCITNTSDNVFRGFTFTPLVKKIEFWGNQVINGYNWYSFFCIEIKVNVYGAKEDIGWILVNSNSTGIEWRPHTEVVAPVYSLDTWYHWTIYLDEDNCPWYDMKDEEGNLLYSGKFSEYPVIQFNSLSVVNPYQTDVSYLRDISVYIEDTPPPESKEFLDKEGLIKVWANIKSYISSKIPTKTSQLQNDSNYATTSQLPSKTSQLTNDSDFTTNAKLATKQDTISDLATIRSGASKGATAVQPSVLNNYLPLTGGFITGNILNDSTVDGWKPGFEWYYNNVRYAYIHAFTNEANGEKSLHIQADTEIKIFSNKLTVNGRQLVYADNLALKANTVRSVNEVNADNNGTGEIIQGYYVPNGIVQKSGSVYFGTLVQPEPGTALSDFRDINITITDEFHPEAGKIYDYSQIFSTLYLHSYDSDSAVGATFDCGSNPKVDKWFGGWVKVAGRNLVRNSGKYLCTSVSPYGYAVTLRYNLTMTCEKLSYRRYECKIVSKTVPQNQMTVTAKATFMRVG